MATLCSIIRTTPRCITIAIDAKKIKLDTCQTQAFRRVMALRGWSAQQVFDHLMSTSFKAPWKIIGRLGRRLSRKAILEDQDLGPLYVTRNFVGTLQAYRKHLLPKACSTSFTSVPHSWAECFAHVKAGDVHDAKGDYLFTLV